MTTRRSRRHALLAAAAVVAATATVATAGAGTAGAASAPCSCSSYPSPVTEAAGINALGARLQQMLAGDDPAANVVISPLSIEAALAMASAGASGATQTQMNDVLGLGSDAHSALGQLLDSVVTGGGGSLELANSLWAQSGLATQQAFLDVLRDAYASELYDADFRADPGGAREEINAWVADATHDRIPELLSPEAVTALTRFILVNAVSLDADWASPFEPDNTRPEPFATGSGETVAVDTMHQTLFADYADSAGLQAITLPYTEGYEMVVVLPGEGALADFEQQLVDAGGDLDTLLGGWSSSEVSLALPTWDIETSTGLSAQLQQLGIVDAFDPALADFSGLTTDEPIFIGDVIHEANITVDEAGTEAAAATAVIAPAGAAPGPEPEPIEMTVDRPFFFTIRDAESGTTLFQGRVSDPSSS